MDGLETIHNKVAKSKSDNSKQCYLLPIGITPHKHLRGTGNQKYLCHDFYYHNPLHF